MIEEGVVQLVQFPGKLAYVETIAAAIVEAN